ncbi:LSU rRNA 2'-O-methyl-C2498 methyl transferase RlmM [Salmonella enterica subsp. enterica]|nr:LSU rRNA 2'-O-methyl-C2498 methyl transferase RlmM [Salmonella enterica subsp. enterica]
MNKVVLLCRPGFEKECAAEITDKAGKTGNIWFCTRKRERRLCHL